MVVLVVMMLGCLQVVKAQVDPHYSQYYVNPIWLNPGLTGVIDGDYRVTAIYRNQWNSLSSGFSTPGISADINLDEKVSLGMNVFNQTAGNGGYNYLNGYLTFAYSGVRFGKSGGHRISFGLSGGIINRWFNTSKFQTGEQWTAATGYDPSIMSNDIPGKTSALNFDVGAGAVYYDVTPGKKANLFLGFSAFHLTRPSDPFISGGEGEKLPIRYTAHGGVRLRLSDNLVFTPNLLYMRQGNAEEKMAGGYLQLNASGTTDFLIGANYRFEDAIVPFAGFYYKNFIVGVSYDVNASDLGKVVNKANSFEISLTLLGRRKAKMSTEEFICPRL